MTDDTAQNTAAPQNLKSEALKWFGILGTAFTIFSNAGSFIDFSKFVKHWTDQWRELITALVNFVAQIVDLSFDESIAVILFSVISCLIVSLSAQGRLTKPWTPRFRIVSATIAAALSAVYFCFVILGPSASDPRMQEEIVIYAPISFGISLLLAGFVFARASPDRNNRLRWIGVTVFVLILALGPVTEFGAAPFIRDVMDSTIPEAFFFGLLSTLVVIMYFVSQPISIAFRSLGILIVVAALVGLNLFATWIEHMGWLA